MSELWQTNIKNYRNIIETNQGPKVVNVVSGSPADRDYWQDRLQKTAQDVFRADGDTLVISSMEASRKGNFLGDTESSTGQGQTAGDFDEHGVWAG
jgi:hypothetical protein